MKKFVMPTIIVTALLLSACDSVNDKKTPIDKEKTSAFNEYKGVWEQKGFGNIWLFDDDNYTSYNFNQFGCIKTETQDLKGIEELKSYLSINDSQSKITFDNLASNNRHLELIEELPVNCLPENLLTQMDLPTNFEYLWHTMNDYYAFFEVRGINWQSVYEEYRPQINSSTTKENFFEIIDDVFSEFGDGHLFLSDGDDFDASGAEINGFILEVLRNYNGQVEIDEIIDNLKAKNDQVLSDLLVDKQFKTHQGSDAIRWGKVSNNIGYIRIDRVQDINFQGEPEEADTLAEQLVRIKQDLEDTNTIMEAALGDVDKSEALIIDLRFNTGGYDNVSLNIANYFSHTEQTVATKKVFNQKHISDSYQLNLTKSPIDVYSKPIYVITGRSTSSGGEVLAMALKALPNVTLIGEATNGSVSDILEHTLPNGWKLSLSHEVYLDNKGEGVENVGVLPDVEMPVYASQDLSFSSNTPVDYVLQTVGGTSQNIPTKQEVEEAFSEYFIPTKIPGIAVAVIKDDRIVYQKAYGLANVAQVSPVTMDTPFNVASISKTILATAIMQKVEQGKVNLADKLTSMNLSFDPNNPVNENPNDSMTLRHLVTHTSGIRDSQGYICSHFIHESELSLLEFFGQEGCPENPTKDATTFFAYDYFNEGGRYVMDGVYLDGEDGVPGNAYEYSNIATGLAGYAVEQKLNIDLPDSMKNTIFRPLNMNNTAWRHTELNTANPKATQYMINSDLEIIEVPEYSYPTVYEGDLNMSANDLATFLITIMNGGEYQGIRILNQDTVENMLSSQTDVFNRADIQGVFWYWSGAFVGHYGGDLGVSTIMQYNKVTKTGLVVLMNGEDGIIGKGEASDKLLPLMSMFYRYGLNK